MLIAHSPVAPAERRGTALARVPNRRARPGGRRVTARVVWVLALAAGIAGCGGSSDNGVAAKSPDAILAATQNAVRSVKSVHIAGTIVSGGAPITFDLNLAAGQGGRGQISQTGLGRFQMIVLHPDVYINGSDAFLRHFGGATAVQLFHGRWLKGSATGQLAGLAQLTDIQRLFTMFLSNHGTLAKGGTSTVNGQKVIAVHDTTAGGTLYVATTGKPYPVQVSKTAGGRVVFDRYNQPVSLSAPANAIDLTKLSQG